MHYAGTIATDQICSVLYVCIQVPMVTGKCAAVLLLAVMTPACFTSPMLLCHVSESQ